MSERVNFANSIPIVKIYQDFTGIILSDRDVSNNVLCPFHKDNKPSMKLYTSNNRFKCFGCGLFGGPIDFVIHLLYNGDKSRFIEVVNMLCKKYGYTSTAYCGNTVVNREAYNRKVAYTSKLLEIAQSFHNNAEELRYSDNYFTKRGISEEVQKEYNLGYCKPGQAGLYQDRWIVPIADQYGYILGFAGRCCDDQRVKYINSPTGDYFHKSELLFNYHIAKRYDSVYVVEGFLDALSMVQAGIQNVVALMGCTMSDAQLELLRDKNIILALDNDDAGKQATNNILNKYPSTSFQVLQRLGHGYKDMNDVLVNKGINGVIKCANRYKNKF